MNKRGQVYLLVALILALVLYMLITKTNIIYEHEIIDDFETLSRNYDIEASKFMNSLLSSNTQNPETVKQKFDIFTIDFTSYAKNQNPDFSLIYVFAFGENIYVGNHLKNYIIVKAGSELELINGCLDEIGAFISTPGGVGGSIPINVGTATKGSYSGCVKEFKFVDTIDISIGSVLYEISINKERPEIIIVGREEKGEQRKVYTKKEFVEGSEEEEGAKSISDFCGEVDNINQYGGVCAGIGKAVCGSNYYNKFKEACEHDENCCWDEINKECKNKGECKNE